MRRSTRANGFRAKSPADFAAIPDDQWNAFISRATQFDDWRSMQEEGAKAWMAGRLFA